MLQARAPPSEAEILALERAAMRSGRRGDRIRPPPPPRVHHSTGEEVCALAALCLGISAIIMSIYALTLLEWKVHPESGEGFGLRYIHIGGSTHYLETVGLVGSVYTASRCALGFSVIGVILAFIVLPQSKTFIVDSRGHLGPNLGVQFVVGVFFLFAIMLYPLLFPNQPFSGNAALVTVTNSTAANATDPAAGVPTFPDSGGSGSGTDVDPSSEEYQDALVAYERLGWVWTLGKGYWLMLSSALCMVAPAILYAFYSIFHWLWVYHHSNAMEQKFLSIPAVSLLVVWVLSLVALGAPYWKFDPSQSEWTHFGLDQIFVSDIRYTLRYYSGFSEEFNEGADAQGLTDQVRHVSNTCLAFGILAIVSGAFTWVEFGRQMYDGDRSIIAAIIMACWTTLMYFIVLLVYGVGFPQHVGVRYMEFGWSFYLFLACGVAFFCPLFALICWKACMRAKRTSHDERRMFLPVALTILAFLFSLGSIASEYWIQKGEDVYHAAVQNHLGLLSGWLDDERLEFNDMAQRFGSLQLGASVATMVLIACAMIIQLPVMSLGMMYVAGRHHLCRAQLPLLSSALSLASTLLYLLASILYAQCIAWDQLDSADFQLGHSWRTQLSAAILTTLATAGFVWRTKPRPQGEPNILAETIGK